MSKFSKIAKEFMEKQLKLQDKVKEENELARLLKRMHDLGRYKAEKAIGKR